MLTFDLEADETQIWLADADEHLRTLGEGFVQLELTGRDPVLLDRIFRAPTRSRASAQSSTTRGWPNSRTRWKLRSTNSGVATAR